MNRLNKDVGFSLIEILIVIAIIGILISVSIPNFSRWKKNYEIDGEIKKVYFDLLLAHSLSIKNNYNVRVTFDPKNNIYKIHNDNNNNGIEDSGENIKATRLENNMKFGFNPGILDFEGNLVTSAIFFRGGNTIIFNSRGQASTSGSIFLIHKNNVGVTNDRLGSIYVVQATSAIEYLMYKISGSSGSWN